MKKNNKKGSDFFLEEDVKDIKLDTKYKRSVIVDVGYKKIDQEEFLSLSVFSKKIDLIFIIISIVVVIVLAKLFYLQISKGNYYREVAEGNRIRVETIKAPRGLIYDRNNKLLVKNIPNFVLTVTIGDLPARQDEQLYIFDIVSKIIDMPRQEIEEKLSQASLWQKIEIIDNLSYEQAIKLMIASSQLPGVKCEGMAIREYSEPEMTSHVIGYLGKINEKEIEKYQAEKYLLTDYIGKTGLELYYEKLLKGTDGKKQVEIDSLGNEIKTIAQEDPITGDNLMLSLDIDLQTKAYEVVEKYSLLRESKGGVVIAIDPRDGEILAAVSWPGFDSNEFIKGIKYEDYQKLIEDESNPLFNRIVSGEYPSGSTFKPVVAAAALQEGVITAETTVNSTGGIQINEWYFPDWKDGGHGITNVTKGLAESVNTFFYIAGGGIFNEETNEIEGGLGINKINKYAKLFGLGKKTNIDLVSERTGFLPTKKWKEEVKGEDWYIGDTYHVSIGQGDILTTPIQVANFTATIANGGTLYRPHFVQKITNSEQETKENVSTQILNSNFVNKRNIEIVRQGMREAVIYGSAKKLQNLPVAVAAKTGTAEHSGSDRNHSWLTSFAPYHSPEIVVTALIEEGGEGTEAALPVVQEILDWYFSK